MKSFVAIKEMTKSDIIEVLDLAEKLLLEDNFEKMRGKIVGSLFFEPSTRTRLSFTSSAYRLGANVLGFDSPDATSLKKGESLRDTIKMVSAYSDVIVMRHNIEGAAKFATEMTDTPIINAGDGANEHPSQTLLDLFTIRNHFSKLENLKIAFVGDLKYGRTVHSLVRALKYFNNEFYFVAPESIQIPEYILQELEESKIAYKLFDNYEDIIGEIDVMYMTRIQKERFESEKEYEKVKGVYTISKKDILGKVKDEMIILHPLPRVDEINIDLDDTKHALYFKQAQNGVPVRMAMYLLATTGEKQKKIDEKVEIYEAKKCFNKKCVSNIEQTENKVLIKEYGKYCYYCGKEIK